MITIPTTSPPGTNNVETESATGLETREPHHPDKSLELLSAEIDWVLDSPPLMLQSAHPALIDRPFPAALSFDKRHHLQKNLWQFFAMLKMRKSTRLGIRYETLWQYLNKQNPDSAFLTSNLQVRGSKRTIGEFDLLYFSHSRKQYIHQELAVKFYLGKPDSAGNWEDWVGPDHSDQLKKKLTRMFQQQIKLSETEDGEKVLCNLLGSSMLQQWHSEILLQGYLFYPWKKPCAPPRQSNPEHLRGDWLPASQLKAYCRSTQTPCFSIPPREQWLALMALAPTKQSMDSEQLSERVQTLLSQSNRPILIIGYGQKQNTLFFVVPETWLESTTNNNPSKI